MSTAPDDIRVGMWLAVTGDKREPLAKPGNDAPWWLANERTPLFSGEPVRVLAVNLPFIVIKTRCGVDTIDLRAYAVTHCTRKYVRAIYDNQADPRGLLPTAVQTEPAKSSNDTCPKCGASLRSVFNFPGVGTVRACICGYCER